MFSTLIRTPILPLTNKTLKDLVNPSGAVPDYTLACLCYALMKPRLNDEYRGINGSFQEIYKDDDVVSRVKENYQTRNSHNADWKTLPSFNYIIFAGNYSKVQAELEKENLTELKAVETYIKTEMQMEKFLVFISEEINSVWIIVPSGDISLYHFTLAFLYNYFPAIFTSISQDEIAVLKALTRKSPDNFIALFSRLLEPMKEQILRTELASCFRGFRQQKIKNAEAAVQDLRNRAERHYNEYLSTMTAVNQAVLTYEGLKVVCGNDSDAENELVDYIAHQPRLYNVSYEDGFLRFDTRMELVNFDQLKWKNAVRRNDIMDGYRLDAASPFQNAGNRKLFLSSLFDTVEPELVVNLKGHFDLLIDNCGLNVGRGDTCGQHPDLDKCLMNPHYYYHGCPGANRDQITRFLREADLISAIECAIAATGSVNIGETDLTFRPFLHNIMTTNKKIIHRLSDGVDMTPAEALLYLIKKQENAA